MFAMNILAAVLCLAGTTAAIQMPEAVFLDKQQASSLISRQKRSSATGSSFSNLEQACMERICTYEEARKFFQDSYRTDIFWSVYIDGDQCATNPCKNGAMCSDSVGGYDCVCKSGFSGVHCETDKTLCTLEKDKGCSQFCKPGYTSYECSCARGWKISSSEKDKCVPAGPNPCGKVTSLRQWDNRQTTNAQNNFEGLPCTSTECPWQALLISSESGGFCSGVLLKENLVLTSAQCALKYPTFEVATGKLLISDRGEQTLPVKTVHVHPRYVAGQPDNDLAVIELRASVTIKLNVKTVCLPEKDFAESVLMSEELPAVITGWKIPIDASAFEGPLTINYLKYSPLTDCVTAQPELINNKMGCTAPLANADCTMSSGSPLVTLYREVFFLTGVVTRPEGADCTKGYIFQKVSRHLSWLESFVGSR